MMCRFAIRDWLSLRAALSCAPLLPSAEGYPVIACGMGFAVAGFFIDFDFNVLFAL